MRILFLTRVPATAFTFIFPLASRLKALGNEVEFAFGPGVGLQDVGRSGFRFHLLNMDEQSRSFGNIRVIQQLRSIIAGGRYDIVHTYSPVIGLYGRIAAALARGPLLVHSVIGSMLGPGVPFTHRVLYATTELLTSWMVDLFITLNAEDASALVRYRLAKPERVYTLKYEYGVNLEKFNSQAVDQESLARLRCELGLNDGVPTIGFIGRMIGAKGILELFEAFCSLRSAGTKAKLLFLGDVLSTDKDVTSFRLLKEKVAQSDYSEDVIFLGFQMDVPLYIELMDFVVHPTHHEGFPRIPIEAGAMQKPSICTAVAGADVAIADGKTGVVVPLRDTRRLTHAMHMLVSNADLRRRMGAAAKARVVELFDEGRIVEEQIGVYQGLFDRVGKGIREPRRTSIPVKDPRTE